MKICVSKEESPLTSSSPSTTNDPKTLGIDPIKPTVSPSRIVTSFVPVFSPGYPSAAVGVAQVPDPPSYLSQVLKVVQSPSVTDR